MLHPITRNITSKIDPEKTTKPVKRKHEEIGKAT